MDLNAYDLLILHLNVNRKVGNEVTHHNYIIENKIPVSKHLQNLIDKDILVLKSDYNNSLPLLKIPELKEILRNNNLKVGGKKQELIERIKTNVPIQKVQLDEVYVATAKGKELIKETEYILHFYNSHLISLASAHNIANKNINSEDKIETIYQSLIKKSLNSSNEQYNLISILHSLIRYYKKIDKDETQIRQFVNFLVYLELSKDLEHLSLRFKLGETVNDISGSFYINSDNLEYYENQLLIKKEKKQTLKTLFYKDIILFINADQNLCEEFFYIILSKVYNKPLSEDNTIYIREYLNEHKDSLKGKYNFSDIEVNVTSDNSLSNSNISGPNYPTSPDPKVTTKSKSQKPLKKQEQVKPQIQSNKQESLNNSNSFSNSQSKDNSLNKKNKKVGIGCLWVFVAMVFLGGCTSLLEGKTDNIFMDVILLIILLLINLYCFIFFIKNKGK